MRMRNTLSFLAIALSAGLLSACGATMGGTGTTPHQSTITREELAETNARNVYDALQRARPSWMRARGPVSATDPTEARPTIYMNGNRYGDLESLKDINVEEIQELRYWEPGQASARFGMGNPSGVIEVIRRR